MDSKYVGRTVPSPSDGSADVGRKVRSPGYGSTNAGQSARSPNNIKDGQGRTDSSTYIVKLAGRLHGVSETPWLDAQVAVGAVTGQSRSWVLAHPDAMLDATQVEKLEEIAHRLEMGEPLPYILGHWEFYGLDFIVNSSVLIPRPETELLVEQGLKWLRQHEAEQVGWAIDIGTGSGCIAISLAVNQPGLQVIASDVSLAALRVAQSNAQKHGVAERVHLVQSDLLPALGLAQRIDLICANLPYIPSKKLAGLRVMDWEPRLALDGGVDGMELIRRLLTQVASLGPETGKICGKLVLCEIEATQGERALRLAMDIFPRAKVDVLKDLAGRERCLRILLEDIAS